MNEIPIKLSLRITHPSDDMRLICNKLGLSPTIIWKAGDNFKFLPGRKLSILRQNDLSYCSIPFEHPNDRIQATMLNIMEQLYNYKSELLDFTNTGGKLSFAIAFFCDEDSGEPFDLPFLKMLVELNISLELFLYSKDINCDS